jgi:Flp pilus assembly protein TadD
VQLAVLLEAAHLLMAQGRWKKAEVVLEGMCLLAPAFDLAWLARGTLAMATGSLPRALEHFRSARRYAPRSGLVRAHLAEALLQLGRRGEARLEYTAACKLGVKGVADALARARFEQLR